MQTSWKSNTVEETIVAGKILYDVRMKASFPQNLNRDETRRPY